LALSGAHLNTAVIFHNAEFDESQWVEVPCASPELLQAARTKAAIAFW
jgi:hypothetical protein